jgi:hypothetical protein
VSSTFDDIPVQKRPYKVFVSYSHQDYDAVADLVRWLEGVAGVKVWWDDRRLAASSTISSALPAAIKQAQSAAFVVSQASAKSGWVREEYGAALLQRTKFDDYHIIVLKTDGAPVPDFLQTTKWVEMPAGKLGPKAALEVLTALYTEKRVVSPHDALDVYVSRSWRTGEAAASDAACVPFCKAGFRLIGDSKDQKVFDPDERVRAIMSSCGAVVALAPDRGGGQTSRFIVEEVELAARLGLPYLLITDDGVVLDKALVAGALEARTFSLRELTSAPDLATRLADVLHEHYRPPPAPHYVFYAASLMGGEVNEYVCRLVELVTGMGCVMGQNLYGQHAQREITERIGKALFVLADVSEENKNTLIEAGIARGAGTRLHLVCSGEPRPTRFMFRDLEVSFYKDPIELLGVVHKVVYPYRRRVLNRELPGVELAS